MQGYGGGASRIEALVHQCETSSRHCEASTLELSRLMTFDLRLRWTNREQMWGYPHALSHESLRTINEFAEAELTAMVIFDV